MYADNITNSMRKTIETEEERSEQKNIIKK